MSTSFVIMIAIAPRAQGHAASPCPSLAHTVLWPWPVSAHTLRVQHGVYSVVRVGIVTFNSYFGGTVLWHADTRHPVHGRHTTDSRIQAVSLPKGVCTDAGEVQIWIGSTAGVPLPGAPFSLQVKPAAVCPESCQVSQATPPLSPHLLPPHSPSRPSGHFLPVLMLSCSYTVLAQCSPWCCCSWLPHRLLHGQVFGERC